MKGFRAGIGIVVVAVGLVVPGAAAAQEATPIAGEGPMVFTLVERAEIETYVDLGDPGTSGGDLLVWGPNPLYDKANAVDTGALTFGSCMTINAEGDNHCIETVLFPDGSTLEIQGVQQGSGEPSLRTIVGGSGDYLGAVGTTVDRPSDDLTLWSKTFEVYLPDND